MSINFNCKKQIEFDNFGVQPPSPLVLILTNEGILVTFFAINLESKNKSLCQEVKPMRYVQPTMAPQQQQQQPQQQQHQVKANQAPQLTFNAGGLSQQPTFGGGGGLNITAGSQAASKFPQMNAPAPSFNFTSMPPSASPLSLNIQSQKQPLCLAPTVQPQMALNQQIPQQNSALNILQQQQQLQQQQKNNLYQLQQQQPQQQQQQQQNQMRANQVQFQQHQQPSISTPSKSQNLSVSCQARVEDFKKELDELWIYSKAIKNESLAKPLQLTKETTAIIGKFGVLNKEMKVICCLYISYKRLVV